MFSPIKDEIQILLQDLILLQGVIIDEQNEVANNPCAFIKHEGALAQLQQDIERVSETSINISNHIEYIMANAMDGNYSAKMKLVEDENELLRRKIEMLEEKAKTIVSTLDNGNKIRSKVKSKSKKEIMEDNIIEENLEL